MVKRLIAFVLLLSLLILTGTIVEADSQTRINLNVRITQTDVNNTEANNVIR
jgi:hypothetical protein